MSRLITGVFWLGLYVLVCLAPVFLLLLPPLPSGRGFWLELSVALGFVGLTQIAVQFVLTARFRWVTAPYGIDIILRFHRQIALLALAVIVAHPLIIVLDFPSRLELLNPLSGNWASRCGWISLLALTALAITSVFRRKLRLGYEAWRLTHLVLGVTAVAFAQLHVSLAGLYKNVTWKQALWISIAVTMLGLAAYLRLVRPLLQKAGRWRVVEVRRERGSSVTLALEPVGHEGLSFAPGQFVWLKLRRSPFTLEEHPFSISSSALQPDRVELGIKALGDFTQAVQKLEPGTTAYLDGPHGAFQLDRYGAAGYVFIAGGVGITPILSMLSTMADRRDVRPALLIYAQKSWEEVTYREQLAALKERLNLEIAYAVPDAPGQVAIRGRVDREALERHLPKEKITREYFVCGPPPMMDAVVEALGSLGVAREHIHLEKFDLA
jgi:predicted ferric reductase